MNYNDRLSGNEAIAFAMKQIDPDVMAAFPITPSTEIPQYVSSFLAEGKLTTEFITVESEHSAIPVPNGNRLEFDYDHCKGRGICAAACPFGAISYGENEGER